MEDKNVKISITGDASSLKRELKEAELAAKMSAGNIERNLDSMTDRDVSNIIFGGKKGREAVKMMTRELSNSSKMLKEMQKQIDANPVEIPVKMSGFEKTLREFHQKIAEPIGKMMRAALIKNLDDAGKVTKFARNMKASFGTAIEGMKKDIGQIWDFGKGLVVPLTVVGAIGAGVVTKSVQDSNAVEYERTMAFNQFLGQFTEKDKEYAKNKAAESALEMGASQIQYYKAMQALGSANVKGTGKEIADIAKEVMKYNVTGGSVEDLDTSVSVLSTYIQGLGKTINLDTIKKTSDKLNKAASMSAGKDYVVKEQLSKTMALGKFAGLTEDETLGIYTSLVGATGNPDEAETQTKRMAENMIRFSKEEKDTWMGMGFKESPDKILKKVGLQGLLTQLKERAMKAIPEKEKGKIEKKQKELNELGKEQRSYRVSTETIDPKTGKYIQVETEESVRRNLKYKEKRIELEKELQELMKKGLEYSSDPFKENLGNIFQDINAFLPAIYLTGDGFDRLKENMKGAADSAEETDNRMKGIKEAGYFNFDQEAARLEAFRVELGDFVKGNVLSGFKELNDLIEKNKDTIKELASNTIKFFIDKTKEMIEWIGKNKEGIKKFWEESKKVWEEFKIAATEVWDVMGPIMKNLWDGFEKLSPEMKAAVITGLLFHNTISGVIGVVGTLIKSLPLLASPLGIIAGGFIAVAGAAHLYKMNMEDIIEKQRILNEEYNKMDFSEKNDIMGIDNRIKSIDLQIKEVEGGGEGVVGTIARALKLNSTDERVVLQRLEEQREQLVNLKAFRRSYNSEDNKKIQKQEEIRKEQGNIEYLKKPEGEIEIENYMLKEFSGKTDQYRTVINQTIQGTIVTQEQVNSATNKATQTYNIKNGLNAEK